MSRRNLDWSKENTGYARSGCCLLHEVNMVYTNDGGPVLTIEPATPGKTMCCMYCATPLIIYACCCIPFLAFKNEAIYIGFINDETNGNVMCRRRVKSAWAEQSQTFTRVISIRAKQQSTNLGDDRNASVASSYQVGIVTVVIEYESGCYIFEELAFAPQTEVNRLVQDVTSMIRESTQPRRSAQRSPTAAMTVSTVEMERSPVEILPLCRGNSTPCKVAPHPDPSTAAWGMFL